VNQTPERILTLSSYLNREFVLDRSSASVL
jgi:hypothetical protein